MALGRCSRLTTKASSWTTIEREVAPAGSQTIPTLWNKHFDIFTKDATISVHGIQVVHDYCSFRHKEWGFTIIPAALGKTCITSCLTCVRGDDRMKPKRYCVESNDQVSYDHTLL